jgi:hypothetical protein
MNRGIRVAVRVEILESNGHAFTYEETSPDIRTGDNPRFFARDVEHGIDSIGEKVVSTVAGRFGDVPVNA